MYQGPQFSIFGSEIFRAVKENHFNVKYHFVFLIFAFVFFFSDILRKKLLNSSKIAIKKNKKRKSKIRNDT